MPHGSPERDTSWEASRRSPGTAHVVMVVDLLSVARLSLSETRGFASPPRDGFAFVELAHPK
jgi:hypothetical protein